MNKDNWRTPPELISDALHLLNVDFFDTDVCCSDNSVKIKNALECITEHDNALISESWFLFRTRMPSFCNPPFSKKWEFVKKANEQVFTWHKSVLMVIPYTPATKAWRNNIDPLNCIIYVPDGRYHFLNENGEMPKDKNGKKTSPDFAVALVLIVPFFTDGAKYINYEIGVGNGTIKR